MKLLNILGTNEELNLQVMEALAKEWGDRGNSVAVIRYRYFEEFIKISGCDEKSIDKFLDLYTRDYVLIEGECGVNAPNLIAGEYESVSEHNNHTDKPADCGDKGNDLTLARVASVQDLPAILPIIDQKLMTRMPNYPADCCTACGSDCRGMTKRILDGTGDMSQCILQKKDVQVFIDGKAIPMVPFVKRLVRNVSTSVLKELDGYSDNSEIVIKLN